MLFALGLAPTTMPIGQIDRLAQDRNVLLLQQLLEPTSASSRNPFEVLSSGGPYGGGSSGWRALERKAPDGKSYVVFSTPLTTEDVGELVFQRVGPFLRPIPETDDLGVTPIRHQFEVWVDANRKLATIQDVFTVRRSGRSGIALLRLGPQYQVRSMTDSRSRPVAFVQAGGTVFVNLPSGKTSQLRLVYGGRLLEEGFAASIGKDWAQLTNSYWYPMVARKPAAYSVTIHPPKGWDVVGQGVRLPNAGDAVRYRMDLPVTYFSLSMGRYRTAAVSANGRTYRAWSPRIEATDLRQHVELMRPVVEFYAKQFGGWPFAGYGALDSPVYGGGALEAYSYATYGGGLPYEDAHEPSHTIFGGVLGNDYLKSFWNESFAVFSEGFYRRRVPIGSVADRSEAFIQEAVFTPDYSLFACDRCGAYDGPVASGIGYGKGAMVLQMLEQWIGSKRFAEAVVRWRKSQPAGALASWEGFEKQVIAVAPELPVRRFFDGWISKPIVPKVWAARGDGQDVAVHVEPAGFVFPLDVLVERRDGKRSVETVTVDARSDTVTVPIRGSDAVMVSLDPWHRLLRSNGLAANSQSIESNIHRLRIWVDPAEQGALRPLTQGAPSEALPDDPNGWFLVGGASSGSLFQSLCARAGFKVDGYRLTYHDTTIDLRTQGAVAMVPLGDGKQCAIGLGHVALMPTFGQASVALFDHLGRFLAGSTTPRTVGDLVVRMEPKPQSDVTAGGQ